MASLRLGPPLRFLAAALGGALLEAGAAMAWHAFHPPTEAAADRAAIETVIHDYLLAHPEVLPEAMDRMRQTAAAQQLASLRGAVESPFPAAVLGNPQGRVTLVEFSDYACGHCLASNADVAAAIAANPDLRVVIRELPVLTPQSADAARMALAAARQGKYARFRSAMFAAGRPDAASIASAARAAGLDPAATRAALGDAAISAEIERNVEIATRLGIAGTPGWVIGKRILSGEQGAQGLARAIAAARAGNAASR